MPFVLMFLAIAAIGVVSWLLYELLKKRENTWVIVWPDQTVLGPFYSSEAAEQYRSTHEAGPVMKVWPLEKA
jgi:hypothetical protein